MSPAIPRNYPRILLCGISWLLFSAPALAQQPASAVLHLTDDGFVPGELKASADAKTLRWKSPLFASPFDFPLGGVKSVQYPSAGPQPAPVGEFCFELVDESFFYADLVDLTDAELTASSPRTGKIQIPRGQIRRMYRSKGADSVYLGPNGFDRWKDLAPVRQWRDEGGQLQSELAGAGIYGDLGLPEKALIEVELSWKRKPDFVLALGVDEREATVQQAFRFEVWDNDIVVVAESARDADVSPVQPVASGAGRVRVQAYLDQRQARLILLSPAGKSLATLKINPKQPQVLQGVRLINRKGDVRLEHLRITRWTGELPREAREDQPRLHRADGTIAYGKAASFDPKSKQLTVMDGETKTTIALNAISDMYFAPAEKATPSPAPIPEGTIRLSFRDGARFTGRLTVIEDGHLTLGSSTAKQPLRLPLAELRSLIVLRQSESLTPPVTGKPGRLEMPGVRLKGWLAGGTSNADISCLVWRPDLGANASPLMQGASGRIVYRDPPPIPVAPRAPAGGGGVRVPVPQPAVGGGLQAPNPQPIVRQQTRPPLRPSLYLRSGDTIPCTVTGIDEDGLSIKTPLSDATYISNDKIKSVELVPISDYPRLDDAKRDRLLTLPRLQKETPPTHLICSKNGDFLRGRIVAMDDASLKVEVRLETRTIPRDRVAQIIWLHADELTGKPAPPAGSDFSKKTRVQAVRGDGNRLTFIAEKADLQQISGKSEVLGACRADLADVDQLLFGTQIEESAALLAYHAWRLHHAAEPRFVQAEAEGGGNTPTGIDSPLIGQAGFPFRLDTLDGKKFNLAEHKGKIVVLDFWATWCGPCIESLPLVESTVQGFADRQVELVAVNLEEQPERIKATLERNKLKVNVALDRDGVAAARYAVSAIPQTVVIDREGKIVRLFVGGGKKTAEALKTALQELTEPKPMAK